MTDMTDNLTKMADSPVIKLLIWAVNLLIWMFIGVTVYSYQTSISEIKAQLGEMNRTLSSYTISQATVQIRLQSLETTSQAHSKDISYLRDATQGHEYSINRINEILKVNTSRTRPGGAP